MSFPRCVRRTCGGSVGRGGACGQSGAPDWLAGALRGQGPRGAGDAVAGLGRPQGQGGGGSRHGAGGTLKLVLGHGGCGRQAEEEEEEGGLQTVQYRHSEGQTGRTVSLSRSGWERCLRRGKKRRNLCWMFRMMVEGISAE